MSDKLTKLFYIYAEVNYRGEVNFSEGEIEEYSDYIFDGDISGYVNSSGFCGNYLDCQIYLPIESTDEFRNKIKNDILKEFCRRCFNKIETYNKIIENLDKVNF